VAEEITPEGEHPAVVIILPDGQHRMVPRSATDAGQRSEVTPAARCSLPLVSVRTILPVARFVRNKQIASGEGNDERDAIDDRCGSRPSGGRARSNPEGVVRVGRPSADRASAPLGEVGSPHAPPSDGRS